MLALFIPSSRYGGEQGGTALHWNCSSPPLSLSLRPQFTLCRDLTGRGGVSDQKWPHTISLCVDRHQVAAERLQPGMRSAATRSGPPTFFCLGMFLFTDCHPPLSAPCPPSPRLEDSVCNFSSSQGRRRCIKDKMHGKLEEGTAPNFDRAPDD